MKDKKIVASWISEERGLLVVRVKYGDDSQIWEHLGTYYPDELHFTGYELIDLTKEEALDLIKSRDIA